MILQLSNYRVDFKFIGDNIKVICLRVFTVQINKKDAINQLISAYNGTFISDDYDIEFIAKNDYKAYNKNHKNN